jgi:hypothetical protein
VKDTPSLDRIDGITMESSVDQQSADLPGRVTADKVRPSTRAIPRIELLETRCLMSRWQPSIDAYHGPSRAISATARATERIALPARAHNVTIQGAPRGGTVSDGSSRSENDDSSNGATGSTPISPSSLGLSDFPEGSYALVLETKAPHHTRSTAQVLPDLPFFGVVGTISTSDTTDFYRLSLNEWVEDLYTGLTFQSNGASAPIDFQIFNGAGQLLAEWSSGGQGASVILAELGPQTAGSTLYLGVSVGNSGAGTVSSAGIGYQLWVGRETDTSPSAGAVQESPILSSGTFSSLPAGALTPLAALGTASSGGSPQSTALQLAVSAVGSPVAAAWPPTMRAGRSSVEALSRGESERSTESDFDLVTKGGGERNVANSELQHRTSSDLTSQATPEPVAGALVAMNGPGGFALLEPAAIGHRRRPRDPAATAAGLVTTLPANEPALGVFALQSPGVFERPSAGVFARQAVSNEALLVAVEQGLAEEYSPRARLRSGMPASVFSALGLAVAFTLNAALSQPFAGFDYLASRFDWKRGKLGRLRGRVASQADQVRRTRASQRGKRSGRDPRQQA